MSVLIKVGGVGGSAEYMKGAEQSLRGLFAGFKSELKQGKSLVGWPAAWMTYSYNRDSGAIQELNVTALIGRGKTTSLFQFICEADAKGFSALLPTFEAIIASLAIGSDGLRHPEVILSGAKACTRCGAAFAAGATVNAVRDLRAGDLDAVCIKCMSKG